jgi:hypothetical protein
VSQQPKLSPGRLVVEVSRPHTHTHTHTHTHSRTRLNESLGHSRGHYLHNTQQTQQMNFYALSGIRTSDLSSCAAADLRLIPHGHWHRLLDPAVTVNLNSVTDNCFPAMNNAHNLDTSHSLRARLSADRNSVGRDFLHLSTPFLGPTQPPVQWIRGLFLGDKASGPWR